MNRARDSIVVLTHIAWATIVTSAHWLSQGHHLGRGIVGSRFANLYMPLIKKLCIKMINNTAQQLVGALRNNNKNEISFCWNLLSKQINEYNSYSDMKPDPIVAKALFLYADKFSNKNHEEEEVRSLTIFSIMKSALDASNGIDRANIASYIFIFLVKKFKYLMPLFHYTLPVEDSNYPPSELKPLSDEKIKLVQRNLDAIKKYLLDLMLPYLNSSDETLETRVRDIWTKIKQRVSSSCMYSLSELQNGGELLNFASLRLAQYGKYRLFYISEESTIFNKKTNSLIKDDFIFYADSYLVYERGRYSKGETTAVFQFELSDDKLLIKTEGISQEYIKPVLNQKITNIAIEKLKNWVELRAEHRVSLGDGDNVPSSIDVFVEGNDVIRIVFFFIVGKEGRPRIIYFYGHCKFGLYQSNYQKKEIATEAELEYIPNVSFKRIAISKNYIQYGTDCDCQGYLMEQLEANPKLLAWLFDDSTLVGKSYLALDCGQLQAFQDFYNSLGIEYD